MQYFKLKARLFCDKMDSWMVWCPQRL